jgi:hypothetical protein
MESPLSKFKVADLKEQLIKRGLDSTGLKAELLERLTAAIAAETICEGDSNEAPVQNEKMAEEAADAEPHSENGLSDNDAVASVAEVDAEDAEPATESEVFI